MTSVLDPEVQLAQKLASNDKPVRTKAMKRLRKYVSARSQAAGGFSSDELLRLWKGLFYCLWMQDKPLLQEDLSNQISTLIHSFHHIDRQLLYLETFLQTITREWTGIDRLRMDKFYQLVRFMFRQTFEVLKRRSWNIGLVTQFVDLLTREVLQNCEAPSGLQFHILDLYLDELAAVGSAELTADQNFVFIEPFCKTAAKTKNRTLFGAICKSIFSAIIEQAPFAIEDLMNEVKTTEEDSGQESEEEEEEDEEEEEEEGRGKEKSNSKAVKGIKSNKAEKETDDDESEGSDAELHDIGPVLQFEYGAVAERLFQLASRSGTMGRNRQRLYRIIKVLRDLSEGVFPEDEYPEEVSTDEDDDEFGSRKRMKRSHGHTEDDEATTKRSKANTGKKGALDNKDETRNPVSVPHQNQSQGRKNEQNHKLDSDSKPEDQEMEKQQTSPQGGVVDVKRRRRMIPEAESDISPVSAEETLAASSEDGNAAKSVKRKRRRQKIKLTDASLSEGGDSPAMVQTEGLPDSVENPTPGILNEPDAAATPKKKKKKKRRRSSLLMDGQQNNVAGSGEVPELPPGASQLSPALPVGNRTKKNKGGKDQVPEKASPGDVSDFNKNREEPDASAVDESLETKINQDKPTTTEKEYEITVTMPRKKNKKKNKKLTAELSQVSGESQVSQAGLTDSEVPSAETAVMNCGKPVKQKRRKIPVEFEFEADELEETTRNHQEPPAENPEERTAKSQFQGDCKPCTASSLKKPHKKKKTAAESGSGFLSFQNKAAVPTPLFCKTRGRAATPLSFKKKKNQTPQSESKKVTFGLKNNKTAEFRKTDRSLLLSPHGSSRIPFDPQQKPKCGVLKSPPTTIKTPTSSRNSGSKGLKRRPRAVDFF